MTKPLKLCPAHLYLRFVTSDMLHGTTVLIGDADEENGCIDCDNLPDDRYGVTWAQERVKSWQF